MFALPFINPQAELKIKMSTNIEEIYNFLQLSEKLATSGQPGEAQFAAIKESGYKVVVNLALPESPNALPNEREIVESLGMKYVHIPVVWENPTPDDIARFFNVMEENAAQPVFVHCAANMRVSAFAYLYRRLRESINDEQAKQDLHQIWIPNEIWQKFIQQVIEHYQ